MNFKESVLEVYPTARCEEDAWGVQFEIVIPDRKWPNHVAFWDADTEAIACGITENDCWRGAWEEIQKRMLRLLEK